MADATIVLFVADMRQAGAEASLALAARRALGMRRRPSVLLASRTEGPQRTLHLGEGLRIQAVPWSPTRNRELIASLEAVMGSRRPVTKVRQGRQLRGALGVEERSSHRKPPPATVGLESAGLIATMAAELRTLRERLGFVEEAFHALRRSLASEGKGSGDGVDVAPAGATRFPSRSKSVAVFVSGGGAVNPFGGGGGGGAVSPFGGGGDESGPAAEFAAAKFPVPHCPACDMDHPRGPNSAAACSGQG